jgi:hypothetical protein
MEIISCQILHQKAIRMLSLAMALQPKPSNLRGIQLSLRIASRDGGIERRPYSDLG